jgi:hypothetical protein
MSLDSFQFVLLIGGFSFTVLGSLAMFSDKFLRTMDRTFWKNSRIDKILFTEKSGHFFDRYGRGLGALVLGIGMLLFFFNSL